MDINQLLRLLFEATSNKTFQLSEIETDITNTITDYRCAITLGALSTSTIHDASEQVSDFLWPHECEQ